MTTFTLTLTQLEKIFPKNKKLAQWHPALAKILPEYSIDTIPRVAMFLAQCGHESADFTQLEENLYYRAETLVKVWPRHFSTPAVAKEYENQPEKIANRAYANRMGNGAEGSGDGYKYRGRGIIQLTGKENYQRFSQYLEQDIDATVEYLSTFEGAVKCACWFWTINRLNSLCDTEAVEKVTRIINGGTHGLDDRKKRYNQYKKILQENT